MNSSNACIALALLSTMGVNDAFMPNHRQRAMTIPQTGQAIRPVNTRVYMGSTQDEVDALRAKAQKARDEAQKLAKVRVFLI